MLGVHEEYGTCLKDIYQACKLLLSLLAGGQLRDGRCRAKPFFTRLCFHQFYEQANRETPDYLIKMGKKV